MKTRLVTVARGLVSAALPCDCIFCGTGIAAGHFCDGCKGELQWITSGCERCGQPLPAGLSPGMWCADCQSHPPPFAKAFAPLVYSFPTDSALKALKFQRRLYYAPAFGELLLPSFEGHFQEADAVLPVPLHPRRHAQRGFNQATELSRTLRRKTRLPVIGNVTRARYTRPQTGLDAAERRRNMKAAFEVCGAIRFRCPLIIDDVITTGETCRQLATALLEAGAEQVFVLAVARAAGP